jgi:drug/metabolite transporter (DMT)-like permease
MRPRDILDLVLLAALWGGSFLFTRMAVHGFGPVALIELRTGIAALFLLPLLWWRDGLRDYIANAGAITLVGVTNSALPFALFAYAMLSMTAGFASILNAASPLFGALIGFLWLRQRLTPGQIIGLVTGFLGVALLTWHNAGLQGSGAALALSAALIGTISYGFAANYTTRRLAGVNTLAVATGSQAGAALAMLPLSLWWWPSQPPSATAWLAVSTLGVACSGLAYILYFRLIANVGPTRAIAVTFLIPVFGMLFGVSILGETVTAGMLAGAVVILVGTALATGLLIVAPMRLKSHDSV